MAKLIYTHNGKELLCTNSATRYPDIDETITVNGTEYRVTAVSTGYVTIEPLRSTSCYAYGKHVTTIHTKHLPSLGDRITINGIHYRVAGWGVCASIDLELYTFPTTLTSYLLMLHNMTNAQYMQWLGSLSPKQLETWREKYHMYAILNTVEYQLSAYLSSLSDGTLVYYHNERWEAYNAGYQATATASTLAELLNTWSEATDHLRYDLP